MKTRITVVGCLLAAGLVGQAAAQSCPGGTSRVNNVRDLVGGKTLCAARSPDRWQEFHSGGPASGALIDWKRGSNPVDPTKTVGSWAAENGASSLLTHSYTGGSSFPWLVCQVGSSTTYTLVSTGAAGTITGATFASGQVPCP